MGRIRAITAAGEMVYGEEIGEMDWEGDWKMREKGLWMENGGKRGYKQSREAKRLCGG